MRVGQLEKEAGELQAENKTLATSVAVARESVAQGEEVPARSRCIMLALGGYGVGNLPLHATGPAHARLRK